MVKVLFWIAVFLAAWGVYSNFRIDYLKNQNMQLESENIGLKSDIKRIEANNVELIKQKKKNAELAKEDKSGFDWHRDISNTPIIVKLRKPYKPNNR